MKENKKAYLLLFLIVLIIVLTFFAKNYRNFSLINLSKNKKNIFNKNDLIIDDYKYGTSIKIIKNELGVPITEIQLEKNNYKYKELTYDGLKLYFKENYNNYVLTKAIITSKKYKTYNNIKVSDSITKVFKTYKVENSNGNYIYGNYSINSLNDSSIQNNIYFGYRQKNYILYVNKDSKVSDSPVLTSKIRYDYKNGKIKKITWSYDIE